MSLGGAVIQIVDDVFGMFLRPLGLSLHPWVTIWNWRKGRLMMVCEMVSRQPRSSFSLTSAQNCSTSELSSPGAHEVDFVSSRALLVTISGDGSGGAIDLYYFDEDGSPPDDLPSDPSIACRPPTKVAHLRLPPTRPGESLEISRTYLGSFDAHPTPGAPFATAPDTRVHILRLLYSNGWDHYSLIVHSRYLLSYITSASGPRVFAVKEWDEWGPDNTRFVQFADPNDTMCAGHWHSHYVLLRELTGMLLNFADPSRALAFRARYVAYIPRTER